MESPIISLARAMSKVKLPPTDVVSGFVMRKGIEMLYADTNFGAKRQKRDSLSSNLETIVANITNESIQDACDAAWKRSEQSLESERLVCTENCQQRIAMKERCLGKSSKKSAAKKGQPQKKKDV